MQIDPLQATTSIELPTALAKGPDKPKPAKDAAPVEPIPTEPRETTAAVPLPERVTVSVDASREFVYKFVDAKTGDVISQTPPEQVLEVVRGIQDLLRDEQQKESGVNVRG